MPFDRFGNPYNISLVLRPDDTFDVEAFENYSRLYLPASYAITYCVAFALSSCIVVHTALYYGQAVWRVIRKGEVEKDDIHAKLMRAYPEVPNWWYAAVFVTFLGLSIVASEVWHTGLPVWAILLAIVIVLLYVIPAGYIYALTNQTVRPSLCFCVCSGMLMVCVAHHEHGGASHPRCLATWQADCEHDLQGLCHPVTVGMHVLRDGSQARALHQGPPTGYLHGYVLSHFLNLLEVDCMRVLAVQITATVLAGFVQVGVKQAMFDHIHDICTPGQKSSLTCPHNEVYYTASAVW